MRFEVCHVLAPGWCIIRHNGKCLLPIRLVTLPSLGAAFPNVTVLVNQNDYIALGQA